MTIYVPGRVLLASRTCGGLMSLAVDDLALIGPERIYRSGSNETVECAAILTSGAEIALTGSQETILAAITAAAVPPAIVDALEVEVPVSP